MSSVRPDIRRSDGGSELPTTTLRGQIFRFGIVGVVAFLANAIVVEIASRNPNEDFEPILERQLHRYINEAQGVMHIGQRDIIWLRISQDAFKKGFRLKHLGTIIHAQIHQEYSAIVDKVQVKIYSSQEDVDKELKKARAVYDKRDERISGMTDESVEEFYSCTLCQSFAPDHVCIISPERLGLCGAYNWLDCKASNQINPTGPNQPITKGELLADAHGKFDGVNQYAEQASHGSVGEVSMYSIMDSPMTACGCFECIAMLIPEANGIMIVSREDTSMTPAGMTFSTLAGMAGGGLQTPGVMGHGKFYILSPKFISADGGFKRVVWLSSILKEQMAEQLKAVAEREGDPDLINKIADETICTDVEGLMAHLTEKGHPVLEMEAMM